MATDSNHITLVGCGNMGKALLQGWLKGGIKGRFHVIEPKGLPEVFKNRKEVTHAAKPDAQIKKSDAVVIAVKPQVMNETCAELKDFVSEKTLILSIAAGQSILRFEKIFGRRQPVVRSMPNLPASIGEGMTVAVLNDNVSKDQRKLADDLLNCVGLVEWLAGEKLMDAATAIVGNGPAYVFYLMEVLTKAGTNAGLKESLARTLARQVVIGGATLAAMNPDTEAAILRKNVTSPGGTTEAALKVLMNGEMQKIFDQAIREAANRSEELSS